MKRKEKKERNFVEPSLLTTVVHSNTKTKIYQAEAEAVALALALAVADEEEELIANKTRTTQ